MENNLIGNNTSKTDSEIEIEDGEDEQIEDNAQAMLKRSKTRNPYGRM